VSTSDTITAAATEPSRTAQYLDQSVDIEALTIPIARFPGLMRVAPEREAVARQSGWEHSDNQDGHFGGRGERMIVAARR
jgi:hypothetical protein